MRENIFELASMLDMRRYLVYRITDEYIGTSLWSIAQTVNTDEMHTRQLQSIRMIQLTSTLQIDTDIDTMSNSHDYLLHLIMILLNCLFHLLLVISLQ